MKFDRKSRNLEFYSERLRSSFTFDLVCKSLAISVFLKVEILGNSNYSCHSLSRTRKGPENLFEIGRVRDRERKIGYSLYKGTETLVRDRERFEIEGVRDRESQMYMEKQMSIRHI